MKFAGYIKYTGNGMFIWKAGNGLWSERKNWVDESSNIKSRAPQKTYDVVIFNSGGEVNISDIPAGISIREIRVTNNTTLTVDAASFAGLTVENLNVEDGSNLNFI